MTVAESAEKRKLRLSKLKNARIARVQCTCPTISVTGPSSVVRQGETMTFTANVSGGSQTDATYNWSVDKGTIVEGQGTPVITVSTEGLSDTTVTATVQVGGLCAHVVMKTVKLVLLHAVPIGRLVDEFGPLANDDVKARLDPFASELQADPSATGYIINYGPARLVDPSRKTYQRLSDN